MTASGNRKKSRFLFGNEGSGGGRTVEVGPKEGVVGLDGVRESGGEEGDAWQEGLGETASSSWDSSCRVFKRSNKRRVGQWAPADSRGASEGENGWGGGQEARFLSKERISCWYSDWVARNSWSSWRTSWSSLRRPSTTRLRDPGSPVWTSLGLSGHVVL